MSEATVHCRLEQVILPPPPLERVLRDRPREDNTFLLMPTVVMICRRCWVVVLRSEETDGETIKIHQLVVNSSPSPCEEEEESDEPHEG